ncbi:TetR/AcrR family transcriptional regulator [Mycobacterium xenopi]|uniref:HTH tetR-type domain-containing protein n=2 Tax=Mycobacterium xenopi TaxID=1789 RepID=A0AAD1H5H7_MYCXE|nr:TetR/AcrR family transcriptional regulator [Mycobacterium xenopi]EUA16011.1 bacterial regulatory s, tetR family protein [Mycobacterium xenopi 4042]EUA42866.1 bacterial regulatory s, tetR family protein [Mycobacterium xenopi 3993]MDA3638910.1 TetR/AcrR family transcriptional regulator [Mycobacterium xenopi]MDA3657264.1 TetR/AcrR family transcriptional regulator [Mycobacterium xenopi]MDA3664330.1 TetR/AcrR family transcriptional regulator [Mycobacterium xenopi]
MEIRERILQAALDCFTELGYDRTTVTMIRERSGVSNGALFHHFPNKEAIAAGLYLDAMRCVQEGYWATLKDQPATLRDAVAGIVAKLLGWVESNQQWARFLYAQGHLDWSSDAAGELRTINRDLVLAYREWLGPFIATGQVRDLPMVVIVAVVTGPAHAIAQRWLAGQIGGSLLSYADDLIDAAVASLSGNPTSRRQRKRKLPTTGHVRLQLVADDGTVVAEGEAVTALTSMGASISAAAHHSAVRETPDRP